MSKNLNEYFELRMYFSSFHPHRRQFIRISHIERIFYLFYFFIFPKNTLLFLNEVHKQASSVLEIGMNFSLNYFSNSTIPV